jgi:apolipoprotein N-acyltransferase
LRQRKRVNRFPKLIALLLGVASATGFAPLSLWPVTLITFAVLMAIVEKAEGQRAAFARGYWFGVGHFVLGMSWIAGAFRYQDTMPVWLGWIAVVVLSFYLALYPALTAWVAWRWGRGKSPLPFIMLFAGVWTITEYLRATMFTGFAWNPLGVVAVDFGHASRFVGTYGLSALVVMISASLLLLARARYRDAAWIVISLLIIAGLSLRDARVDTVRAAQQALAQPKGGGALLHIVQPNIGQKDKHDELTFAAESFSRYAALSGTAGAVPRLILWPEAAIPQHIAENDAEGMLTRERLARLLGPKDVLLLGNEKIFKQSRRKGLFIETEWVGAANSVFAIDASGALRWRYDKAHLVPYGEYLGLRWLMEPLGATRLVPGSLDFWSGPGPRSYALPGFGKIGVQICYEIIFSGEVVDRENRPDFLFNPSNEAWFGRSGPPQFLVQARMRALEEGLPVVRATPTGISAIIDAQGQIVQSLPYEKPGSIAARVPAAHPPTLFARFGNAMPLTLGALLILIAVALGRRNR